MIEKVVIVTLKTRLEELIERFNTREQARFYIEHMGLSFKEYDLEHSIYHRSVQELRKQVDSLLPKVQQIDRSFLPNFIFTPRDLVVTIGRDGLVVNTAKYLKGQPILAINPDPFRIDGLLLPFTIFQAREGMLGVLENRASFSEVTMAEVVLNDGQKMLAFNDFFIGQKSHVSARYNLSWGDRSENQSSSGILVSTGAGSTGWLSSARNMAAAVNSLLLRQKAPPLPYINMEWSDPRLMFVVREAFKSRSSDIEIGAGMLENGEELRIESLMPTGGVIFSDGIESDCLAFNSGSLATIRASDQKASLVAAKKDKNGRK